MATLVGARILLCVDSSYLSAKLGLTLILSGGKCIHVHPSSILLATRGGIHDNKRMDMTTVVSKRLSDRRWMV